MSGVEDVRPGRAPTLIFGGAGFIGTNLAAALLARGERVRIFDSLARPGVDQNAQWLSSQFPGRVEMIVRDIRDRVAVQHAVVGAQSVYLLAAQVAVTSSIEDPIKDAEINVLGTLNVLEAVRTTGRSIPLVFTSTNKVYGDLAGLRCAEQKSRYTPHEEPWINSGVPESQPLDFRSPYGCSKGAADQYVLDFAKTYRLPATVFRMSCIYGPHQQGSEDQGWVAHFLKRAIKGEPLTIYGDGKQVRDILFVDDLVHALILAKQHAPSLLGRAFNVGGTPRNSVSLLELIALIEQLQGRQPTVEFRPWRVGDQRWYTSDVRALQDATGWRPTTSVERGLRQLYDWLVSKQMQEARV